MTMNDEQNALSVAAGYVISNGTWFTPEIVAARMVADDICAMHACHLVYLEAIESGNLAMAHCSYCGGWSTTETPDHHLCIARAKRGIPTPVLDARERCYCYNCKKVANDEAT